MKILISVNTHGITGVFSQSPLSSASISETQQLITAEVNAAIEGAFIGGATEVVVNDAHQVAPSLTLSQLDSRAQFVTGYPRYLGRLSGIDTSFQGVCLIGYVAKANSLGVLAHSINNKAFSQIQINGLDLGEAGMYSALAGQFGVPTIMASGDDIFLYEIQQLLPHIQCVQTKRSFGFQSGMTLSISAAAEKIRTGVTSAIENIQRMTPFTLVAPIHTEINTTHPAFADMMCILPTIRRIQHNRIAFSTNSVEHAFRTIQSLSYMISSYDPFN